MFKLKLLSACGFVAISTAFMAPKIALADIPISTGRTTPVLTSVEGKITITSTGSITLTTGTAVTVDSNHDLVIEGPINMDNSVNNATAILVDGGRSSNILIKSNITVGENFTATDSNSDGIIDPPFASAINRYGFRSTGATDLIGNVEVTSTSNWVIEGNQSYGIRFENRLVGNLKFDGGLQLTGNDSIGIGLNQGATGTVYLSGSLQNRGQNSQAFVLGGALNGSLIIDGSISGTGYATVSALSSDNQAKLNANNKQQSGALVEIKSSVTNGILLSSTVTDTDLSSVPADQRNNDEDGNGIVDSEQTQSNLSQYGSAAALKVGSTTENITIGAIVYNSNAIAAYTALPSYGIAIRGQVQSAGVFDGVDTKAIEIGGTGRTVTIQNGIGVSGRVQSQSLKANSTGFYFGSGATTPRFDISGSIATATSTSESAGHKAIAIDIASGATLPTINVSKNALVGASVLGSRGQAIAIRDASGTLTSLTNNGTISGTINATDDNADGIGDTVLYRGTAIDASANTVGLYINQIDDSTESNVTNPSILGDILLGSGNDVVASKGGAITGNIDFGAGSNQFVLTDAAVYNGVMTSAGAVTIDLTKGSANLFSGSRLNTNTVYVGGESTLSLSLNTASPNTPVLSGTGVANFANGAKLDLKLDRIVLDATSITVMTASQIGLGNMSLTDRAGLVPFFYHSSLSLSPDQTTLSANFRIRTQSEGNFNNNEYAALRAVLAAANSDTSFATQNALGSPTTEGDFKSVFNQFLPDYAGENLLGLANSARAMTNSLANLSYIKDDNSQYWLQEHGFNQVRDRGVTGGFDSTGFSFAAGRETSVGDKSAIGLFVAYTSASPADDFAIASESLASSDLTIGGYWRLKSNQWRAWAYAGAGVSQFESLRQVITTQVNSRSESKWNGRSLSFGAGFAYDYPVGKFMLTPQLSTQYYRLSEDARQETGISDAFNLSVDERTGQVGSAQGIVRLRYDAWTIKPEVWLGFKSNLTGEVGETKARFRNGADFILNGGDLTGTGAVGGARLFMDSQWSYFGLEAAFEQNDEVTDSNVALRTRFAF
jgi:hypothetical protein